MSCKFCENAVSEKQEFKTKDDMIDMSSDLKTMSCEFPKSDLETQQRQCCFITAWGDVICSKNEIRSGQDLIVRSKLFS
jgi:hypothetical protein